MNQTPSERRLFLEMIVKKRKKDYNRIVTHETKIMRFIFSYFVTCVTKNTKEG